MDLKPGAILLLWIKPGPQGSAQGPSQTRVRPELPPNNGSSAAAAGSLLDSKSEPKPLARASVSLTFTLREKGWSPPPPTPPEMSRM